VSTLEGRLGAVEASLTAKERAVLWLRALRGGREPDRRIAESCPGSDQDEMVGWVRRVSVGQQGMLRELGTMAERVGGVERELPDLAPERVGAVMDGLRLGWRAVDAYEAILAEVHDDFPDEALTAPEVRTGLDALRAKLEGVEAGFLAAGHEFVREQADEKDVERVRSLFPERPKGARR
jgi:hypothetical protein